MMRTLALTLGLAVLGSAAVSPGDVVLAQGGFTSLFDGSTLKGWNVLGSANWSVVDGAIQATSGNGYLVTPMTYGDFQITLEFWVTDDANSGVFIRGEDPKAITAMNAYEVNINVKSPSGFGTGAVVNVAKPAVMPKTGGQWNTYDITARGTRLTVAVNGMQTVNADDKAHARGVIALQYGAGTVKFRNVRIRTL
jgi:hypothetical protein